jgi:hypothetical protein
MQNKNLAPGGSTTVTATPEDSNGNPGALGGNAPTWSAPGTGSGLSLNVAGDGLSAIVTAAADAPPGVTVITVTGQDASSATFNTAFSITIAEQPAAEFGFSFS